MKHAWWVIWISVLGLSCIKDKKVDQSPVNVSDFLPISEWKKNWVYEVEEISYRSFSQSVDTTWYQALEKFDTFFLDNLNRKAARLRQKKSPEVIRSL